MLYYDIIDVSETIDVSKTSKWKKSDICDYWNFFKKVLGFNQMSEKETLRKLNIRLFSRKDDKLLEKHNEIWEKVRNCIKNEFDSEPVYNKKYLKTDIKSYYGKINTNFYYNKISKEGSQYICLSVILIDSVFKTGKS